MNTILLSSVCENDSIKTMIVNLAYIVSAVMFIFGIKMLGNAQTAKKGNIISSMGMLLAVVATFADNAITPSVYTYGIIIGSILFGSAIGLFAAKKVQMTSMPEMVALFNGFGGLASLLVGWAEFHHSASSAYFTKFAVVAAILIGGITFTGSIYAYGKLSGKLSGKAILFAGQKFVNALLALAILGASLYFIIEGNYQYAYIAMGIGIALSLIMGITLVMPIGGGDMPVVISLLNSCSGLAASAAGFVIMNNVLVVAGCLVGASGVILTVIMCKSMNRSLTNVLFSGFGSAQTSSAGTVQGEMKAMSNEDAYYVLESAQSVVFIPGYGMAVAQAQHVVKELGEILESNGAEVSFAIHPVAGRMPGHMNVLLAEADVAYEQLKEMDDANKILETADVAIVIGANDVVNPAATDDPASPIYGMPIIQAYNAKTVFALKRGKGAGFSGLENGLFFRQNTRMLYGDAKATITDLVSQFKE